MLLFPGKGVFFFRGLCYDEENKTKEECIMKVLLLNGSPHAQGNTALALEEMARVFAQEGIEAEIIPVGKQLIRGCVACGGCKKLGKCVFDDAVN